MKNRICAIIVAAVWAVLAVWAWLAPSRDISVAERRQLAQKPAIQGKKLLDGSFMTDFEDASLDQFPLRDTFREAKSLFHRFVLRQSDKSGIYISQGYAAAQEYPLSEASVSPRTGAVQQRIRNLSFLHRFQNLPCHRPGQGLLSGAVRRAAVSGL